MRWEIQRACRRGWSLDDLECADESGLELLRWIKVVEVDAFGIELDYITKRVGPMSMCPVSIVPLPFFSTSNG